MDGNGRWANQRGLERVAGHRAGVETVRTIVKAARKIGIKILTLFAFSTENWARPREEVDALMGLLVEYFCSDLDELLGAGVRIKVIGDKERLPKKVQESIDGAMSKTKNNDAITLVICISYGGRWDIVQATRRIAKRAIEGAISPEEIDENMFASFLDTAGLPDPDLMIRTSGEMRISNFLLWQAAYSELWVTPTLWPDFSEEQLQQAIKDYLSRERRFGCVKEGEEGEPSRQE